MADKRKLQGEIDRCLKKVQEGVETFEDIWQKVHQASNANQKEKYEADLKKEIKKLQRLRDNIKTWLTSNEVKDKRVLLENRKLIETQMERFKVVERETKTKAYSKDGLGTVGKIDPKQQERDEANGWLSQNIEALNQQVDHFESEIELLTGGLQKKKKLGKDILDKADERREWVEKHRFHVRKLETIMRLLDNDAIDAEDIKKINDDVEYYVDSNQDPDFEENNYLYDDLDIDELEAVVNSQPVMSSIKEKDGSVSEDGGSQHGDAASHISDEGVQHTGVVVGGSEKSAEVSSKGPSLPSTNSSSPVPHSPGINSSHSKEDLERTRHKSQNSLPDSDRGSSSSGAGSGKVPQRKASGSSQGNVGGSASKSLPLTINATATTMTSPIASSMKGPVNPLTGVPTTPTKTFPRSSPPLNDQQQRFPPNATPPSSHYASSYSAAAAAASSTYASHVNSNAVTSAAYVNSSGSGKESSPPSALSFSNDLQASSPSSSATSHLNFVEATSTMLMTGVINNQASPSPSTNSSTGAHQPLRPGSASSQASAVSSVSAASSSTPMPGQPQQMQQQHQQQQQPLKNGAPIGDKGRPQPTNSVSSIDSSSSAGGVSGGFPTNLSPSPQAPRVGTPSQQNSVNNKTPFPSSSPSPGMGANSTAGPIHAYGAPASSTTSSKSDSIVTSSSALSRVMFDSNSQISKGSPVPQHEDPMTTATLKSIAQQVIVSSNLQEIPNYGSSLSKGEDGKALANWGDAGSTSPMGTLQPLLHNPNQSSQNHPFPQSHHQQKEGILGETHVAPIYGVAPLGQAPLSKENLYQLPMLEAASQHIPHPSDSERLRVYLPRNMCQTPTYYPQVPPPHNDTVEFFQRLSTETLFFIFYYMEGTKAQYLAAKALKKQSWRFHTKYMMWFQRHEEPKTITDEFEQGTYIYFDYEKWGQRKKEGFTFEYRYLEDKDLN